MASRYFLIPYSLLFCVAPVCTQGDRWAQLGVICAIGITCAAGFARVDRQGRAASTGLLAHENLQWTAFAKFQQIKPGLMIPINSPWAVYPPLWYVQVKGKNVAETAAITPIILISRDVRDNGAIAPSGALALDGSESRVRYFDISSHCSASLYMGLEVDVHRSRMGWARVYWGQAGSFDRARSLARLYPVGETVMQFAFRRDVADHLLRLDPAEGVAESAAIRALQGYRERFVKRGMFIAEPTEPGGETVIKRVRLYCLQ